MTAVTQSEFATLMNVSRKTVTIWKQDGRLVLRDGKIDVDASKTLIEQTGGTRPDVAARHAAERSIKVNPDPGYQKPAAPPSPPSSEEKVGNSLQAARAVKEKYSAMHAKLDYERAIGKLVEKQDVSNVVEDVITAFRQTLENLPHRTAPELVGKDLDAIRATLKQEIHGALAEMEREFTKRIEAIGDPDA